MILAHNLIGQFQQNQTQIKSTYYESPNYLCFVPNKEQSISKLHPNFQQVHHQQQEGVFSNILELIMDKCYIHAI